MPGKTVRFAHTNLVHSPPTPGLSISSFSPASSSGPLTPPQYAQTLPESFAYAYPGPTPYGYGLPYPSSPLAKSPREHLHLHPLLQFSEGRPPVLAFDLRQSPSTITSHHPRISLRALQEPATQPPTHSLTIKSPHLPWVLNVRARGSYVTVEDVLEELYHMLRTNISAEDFHSLPSNRDRRKVTEAYEARYRRIRDSRAYEDEKRSGARRVDLLMGLTRFMGLSAGPRPDVWVMHSS
ncbi:hypothetical protein H0H93_006551 [Arthromyces matolae]|nr:hypothetical protein H0H93_006551 [Arthromyces matolae]